MNSIKVIRDEEKRGAEPLNAKRQILLINKKYAIILLMKHTLITALILAYAAFSFVTPPGISSVAEAMKAQARVNEDVPVISFTVPAINKIPEVLHGSFDGFSTKFTQAGDAIETINQYAQDTQTYISTRTWDDVLGFTPPQALTDQLNTVEWAVEAKNVQACQSLSADLLNQAFETGKPPSTGDLLAYCLARVTNLKERCQQIAEDIAVPLKKLCDQEVR